MRRDAVTALAELSEGDLLERVERLEQLRTLEVAKATGTDPWVAFPHQEAPPGEWYLWLLLAGRGAGKALDVTTPLPTPSGWTRMRDVVPGDRLLDERGLPCAVTLTSPVELGRTCYRVTFSDGSEVVADAEHRWLVWSHAYRKAVGRRVGGGETRGPQSQPRIRPQILTTEEMRGNLTVGKRDDLNLAVPVTAPLELPEAHLPVDPYVLGAWLGDGHRHRAAITTMEPEVMRAFEDAGYVPTPDRQQNAGAATTYSIRAADRTKGGSLHRQLRLLGLLGASVKRIPPLYLRASRAQRERLLAGLMDTDGSIAPDGACEFSVSDLLLGADAVELVTSLGWKATDSFRGTASGRDAIRVRFNPDRPVMTVKRKLARLRERGPQASRHGHRMVVAVTPVDTRPVKCVAVDSPSRLYLAGRAMIPTHNTDACAAYFDRFMRRTPGARGGIVAPTLGDAFEACVYGPSGLLAHNPLVRVRQRAGGTHVVWPNDAEAKLFGAYTREDVERLRAGGNRHLYWAEELAAWRNLQQAWENMELGLRLGSRPHIIGSTTPKPRPHLKALMNDDETVLTRASMHDNPKLPEVQRRRLLKRYAGTRLARQEIEGEYIEDVEGALWTYEMIHLNRVLAEHVPDLVAAVVGVDPSGGDEDGNDEQGIVVAGRGVNGHGYLLADRSCKLTPDGWGKRAVRAYEEFKCDRIVGEANFGGDLVVSNITVAARSLGVTVKVKKVSASRGKAARAEPVSALYEQGLVHHVGPAEQFEQLESQLRRWTPDSGWSPDRLDAAVWALTEVMVNQSGGLARVSAARGVRIPGMPAPARR